MPQTAAADAATQHRPHRRVRHEAVGHARDVQPAQRVEHVMQTHPVAARKHVANDTHALGNVNEPLRLTATHVQAARERVARGELRRGTVSQEKHAAIVARAALARRELQCDDDDRVLAVVLREEKLVERAQQNDVTSTLQTTAATTSSSPAA